LITNFFRNGKVKGLVPLIKAGPTNPERETSQEKKKNGGAKGIKSRKPLCNETTEKKGGSKDKKVGKVAKRGVEQRRFSTRVGQGQFFGGKGKKPHPKGKKGPKTDLLPWGEKKRLAEAHASAHNFYIH